MSEKEVFYEIRAQLAHMSTWFCRTPRTTTITIWSEKMNKRNNG